LDGTAYQADGQHDHQAGQTEREADRGRNECLGGEDPAGEGRFVVRAQPPAVNKSPPPLEAQELGTLNVLVPARPQ
jgi:hypothetical protein